MSIIESLAVSVFSMAVVFVVLAFLYSMVMALSKVLNKIDINRSVKPAAETAAAASAVAVGNTDANGCSTGELKLVNVDEKTAAMIMAIVSHESQIPLSELSFKSIKALD